VGAYFSESPYGNVFNNRLPYGTSKIEVILLSRTDDLLKILGICAVGVIGIVIVMFILGTMCLIVGVVLYSTQSDNSTPTVTIGPVDLNSTTVSQDYAYMITDENVTILKDHFKYYTFVLSPDISNSIGQINVSVSTNGSLVDVMFMDSENFVKYVTAINSTKGGVWDNYIDEKSVDNYSFTFTAPDTDRYYLVIDNTKSPIGGAYAGTDVVAHTVITAD
jgi:hypothetical protein